jgi:hypothetical protein
MLHNSTELLQEYNSLLISALHVSDMIVSVLETSDVNHDEVFGAFDGHRLKDRVSEGAFLLVNELLLSNSFMEFE